MKHQRKELNVDIIGEPNRPLTKEEQLEISAFIQKLKADRKLANKRRKEQKKENDFKQI